MVKGWITLTIKTKHMREIKFRGKSIDTGKWIYGYACFDSKKENAAIINRVGNNEMQHWAVYPETVSEFTGLRDRNVLEIYEGDINQHKGVVTWNNDDASFVWEYKDIETMAMEGEFTWCEIIGNIYENHELIND